MTTRTTLDRRRSSGRTHARFHGAGAWGLALGVWYAVFVRFYQASGGRIGLPGNIRSGEGFHSASYWAGVLILVGGGACFALTNSSVRRWPRWVPAYGGKTWPRHLVTLLVLAPCALGGVFATMHGIGGLVTNALELCGAISIDRPLVIDPSPAVTREGDLWNLFVYEPWFLAMGLTLLAAVWNHVVGSGWSRLHVRRLFVAIWVAVAGLSLFAIITVSLGTVVSIN